MYHHVSVLRVIPKVREDIGSKKNPIVVSANVQGYGPAVGAKRLARRAAMDFCLLPFIFLS
jgi:hypothetical protein